MYKDNSQLRMEDFIFPYGKLDPENDWVKLAALVPWEIAEERYAARFVNNGHPAHPARMALGALLIQRRLKCSDQWLVKHIGENPYLQYFIGMKEYGPCPFGASTLVAFRKRFSEETWQQFWRRLSQKRRQGNRMTRMTGTIRLTAGH